MTSAGQVDVVAGAVTGRVVDGRGLPRPGVWVYAYPFQGARFGDAVGVHSDSDGQWCLELAPGRWQVREPGSTPRDVTVVDTPAVAPVDDSGALEVVSAPAVPSAAEFARRRARRGGD